MLMEEPDRIVTSTPDPRSVKPRVGSAFGKSRQDLDSTEPWQGKHPPTVLSYESDEVSDGDDLNASSTSFLAWRQQEHARAVESTPTKTTSNGTAARSSRPILIAVLLLILAVGAFVAKSVLLQKFGGGVDVVDGIIDERVAVEASVVSTLSPADATSTSAAHAASPVSSVTRCSVLQYAGSNPSSLEGDASVARKTCAQLTRCAAVGETVVVHSTATSDRVCGKLGQKACTPLEYLARVPPSDESAVAPAGQCTKLTVCNGSRAVVVHSSSTTDRVCSSTHPGQNWTADFLELAVQVAAVRRSMATNAGAAGVGDYATPEMPHADPLWAWVSSARGMVLVGSILYSIGATAVVLRRNRGRISSSSKRVRLVSTGSKSSDDSVFSSPTEVIHHTQSFSSTTIRGDILVPLAEGDSPRSEIGRLSLFATQLLSADGADDDDTDDPVSPGMLGIPHAELKRRRASTKKENRRLVAAIKASEEFYIEAGKPCRDGPCIGPDVPGTANKVLIIVRTGNVHYGGTDQGVFFSLHDGETISKEAKLNKPVSPIRNPFEKNQFDVFIDEVTNINSRILNLVLRTDGHRGKKKHILHPEWFLETVTLITAQGCIYHFHCDTWFKRKQKKSFAWERHLTWDTVVRKASKSAESSKHVVHQGSDVV